MIDSDASTQVLERRLQIDRVLALDPLAAVSGGSGGAGSPRTAGAASTEPASAATLAERLPLGRVVAARVVEVPDADHVVADIERWRVSMAWPRGAGPILQPGQQITLRVLAHKPMLLFQSVDAAGDPLALDSDAADDAPTRWSTGALELSRLGTLSPSPNANGPIRFTEPIIEVELVPLDHADEADASSTTRTASPAASTDRIALDDVIVGRASEAPNDSRSVADRTASGATPMQMPIVLQGPAWTGQPVELVVRRERSDDAFENPVLDHWCGELVIDLPLLGRVSGHLAFSMQGLRIRLEGEDAATVAAMSEATASLAAALADAGLRVHALSAGQPGARAMGDSRG